MDKRIIIMLVVGLMIGLVVAQVTKGGGVLVPIGKPITITPTRGVLTEDQINTVVDNAEWAEYTKSQMMTIQKAMYALNAERNEDGLNALAACAEPYVPTTTTYTTTTSTTTTTLRHA